MAVTKQVYFGAGGLARVRVHRWCHLARSCNALRTALAVHMAVHTIEEAQQLTGISWRMSPVLPHLVKRLACFAMLAEKEASNRLSIRPIFRT